MPAGRALVTGSAASATALALASAFGPNGVRSEVAAVLIRR